MKILFASDIAFSFVSTFPGKEKVQNLMKNTTKFFESADFEDAIRNAISVGGDSDTLAAITGGIAEAYYGVPESLRALPHLNNK